MQNRDIIGLHWGWNSTVSLLREGQVLACVSEERFTRKKNEADFPVNALNWILKEFNVVSESISAVALASLEGDLEYTLTRRYSDYSIEDHIVEQKKYWYPKLYEEKNISYLEIFRDKVKEDLFPMEYWKGQIENPNPERFWEDREKIVADFLNIAHSKVKRYEHHACHAAYGYYGSPFRGRPCLIFTIDAYGDGLNATISHVNDGRIVRLFATDQFYLGRMYRYITLLLGMKPDEHEYKVMGLAPYAKRGYYQKTLDIFRNIQFVEGLEFKFNTKPQDLYFIFRDKLEGHRFDCIAGALQEYLEECLIAWVKNAIDKYGIRRVVFSGGVSMNIKAMGKIAQLPEVEELFVCGSGSDDSLAIGAAYAAFEECLLEDKRGPEEHIFPLKNLYLGPQVNKDELKLFLNTYDKSKFKITQGISPPEIARLLADGNIVARCTGRGEFGARALGNRSILANPSELEIVPVINEQIKNRDFWMPFAPVIIEDDWEKYLMNGKDIYSPFMTIGFEAKKERHREIQAAIHPADYSVRPQMLKKEDNPKFWEIVSEFKKLTGIGALLNTSFNLHGEPIVNSFSDAIFVFNNSGLRYLLIEDTLICKR